MQDVRNKPLAYFVQIAGVLVLLLNLWIASKLAPITQDLAVIATRVEAVEELDKTFIGRAEIELQLKAINRRLNSIDGKLK